MKDEIDSDVDSAPSAMRRTFADTYGFRLTYTHVIIIIYCAHNCAGV